MEYYTQRLKILVCNAISQRLLQEIGISSIAGGNEQDKPKALFRARKLATIKNKNDTKVGGGEIELLILGVFRLPLPI